MRALMLACTLCPIAAAPPQPSLRALYSRPVAHWPAPHLDPGALRRDLAPLPPAPAADPALAAAGRALFHDRRLSADGRTACADCHRPAHGFAEDRASVPGVGRNTPGLQALALRTAWGWDGRHRRLGDAILAPLTHPAEMGNPDLGAALRRIGPAMTAQRLAQVVAAYLGQQDRPGRLDRFLGGEADALTDRELRGLHLFRTRARCLNCHSGALLNDGGFHNLRLSGFGEASQDLGRWAVTGRPQDAGRFRTPSLRGVARTAPYMHTGHFRSLAGVVRFYARGGGEVRARNAAEAARPLFAEAAALSPLIRQLQLGPEDIAALVAFLETL